MVAPVFRELLCLGGCVLRCCFRIVFDAAGSARVVWPNPSTLASTSVGVPAALAGKGLVILTEPCLRGPPPYSLQVGTRCRRSSLLDGPGGGLFAMHCQQCEL
ncbi:hypothetical protein Taro_003941 [Colocasia esculenta]|uniref:Uncharacterized protein n=1 Tax=Colocasia esculenta TaxID=4460 RepID=A0A843TQB0_COLES|nr:hypothetical protein [Colocasia esculenta]